MDMDATLRRWRIILGVANHQLRAIWYRRVLAAVIAYCPASTRMIEQNAIIGHFTAKPLSYQMGDIGAVPAASSSLPGAYECAIVGVIERIPGHCVLLPITGDTVDLDG